MKKLIILLILIPFMIQNSAADELRAFKIYNSDGDEVSFEEMAEESGDADIIFFGELHNNTISHWLQLQITKAIYDEYKEKLIIGAEMFESDDQVKVDEYFSDVITQSSFEKEARLWPNYKTDYKPILEYAKRNQLKFVATNIPRRYASLVSKRGIDKLDELSPEAKKFIPPLPVEMDLELPGYKKMEEMFGGNHGLMGKSSKMKTNDNKKEEKPRIPKKNKMAITPDPEKAISLETNQEKGPMEKKMTPQKKVRNQVIENLKAAQAIKDATMAHFILENYKSGDKFLHLNGSFHSNNHEGICWFVKKDRPDLKIITINTESVKDIDEITDEQKKSADFIILVPYDMTTTY